MCASRPDLVMPTSQSPRPGDLPGAAPGRRAFLAGLAGLSGLTLAGCAVADHSSPVGVQTGTSDPATADGSGSPSPSARGGLRTAQPASAAQRVARATVPVLCYHQVRDWAGGDSGYTRSMLIIPPARLAAQLDGIKSAGYTAISPTQYRDHLFTGAQLPDKPVILSFDDGRDNQFSAALPALTQRGMTGTFFIMTVILGNSGWITRDDVKRFADAGMTIGSHTWDHQMVTKYSASKDYTSQLAQPRELLRQLSGQEVDDFAYPYGAWNTAVLPQVQKAGYRSAYQLQDKPLDPQHPELTLRRILAVSTWDGQEVVAKLESFT